MNLSTLKPGPATEREKAAAHAAVTDAVRKGIINVMKPCAACGEKQSQDGDTLRVVLHHPDYSRPLYVVPLCRACHAKVHLVEVDYAPPDPEPGMTPNEYHRRCLASIMHMESTATWDAIHKHVGRLQARIDRADAKSREWAARHPEKVAASNKRAQEKRRAKAKGVA